MARRNPITGKRFGRIVILEDGVKKVRALCDCGKEFTPYKSNVVRGLTSSCGCSRGLTRSPRWKHGKGPTWGSWYDMIRRCDDERAQAYAQYGGRGIKVCERWRSYENFLADMGERPLGMSLDRIDTNGDYEPANCRWADRSMQSRNRRISVRYIVDGERLDTQKQVAARLGVSPSRVSQLVAEGRISTEMVYS